MLAKIKTEANMNFIFYYAKKPSMLKIKRMPNVGIPNGKLLGRKMSKCRDGTGPKVCWHGEKQDTDTHTYFGPMARSGLIWDGIELG